MEAAHPTVEMSTTGLRLRAVAVRVFFVLEHGSGERDHAGRALLVATLVRRPRSEVTLTGTVARPPRR